MAPSNPCPSDGGRSESILPRRLAPRRDAEGFRDDQQYETATAVPLVCLGRGLDPDGFRILGFG